MAILLIVGCTPDRYLHNRSDLRDVLHPKIDSSSVNPGTPLKGKRGIDLRQREIYVSAVSFPAGYNWRKDSLGGPEGCRIVLFRASVPDTGSVTVESLNFEEILSLPAGNGELLSTDYDMHHLIDGHLVTEYSTADETVICKDGEELIRFPGREYLRGIFEMPDGGPVYTLTQNRDGPGFRIRRDLEVILARANGVVFGGFSELSCNRRGGLNLNKDGDLEFFYLISGRTYYQTDFGRTTDGWTPERNVTVKYYNDMVIIEDWTDNEVYMFTYRQDGTLEYYTSTLEMENEFPPGNWYLFPTEGVFLLDGSILLALTPMIPDTGSPAIWAGNELIPVPVNGFLTGVEVVGRGLD